GGRFLSWHTQGSVCCQSPGSCQNTGSWQRMCFVQHLRPAPGLSANARRTCINGSPQTERSVPFLLRLSGSHGTACSSFPSSVRLSIKVITCQTSSLLLGESSPTLWLISG